MRSWLGVVFVGVLACAGLPRDATGQSPGTVQARQGAALYEQHCALCHGADGRGGQGFPRPIWGAGHDLGKFGTAKGLHDYVLALMPFDDPAKLDNSQKLAVVAFMLERNATLPPGTELSAADAARVAIK
jgi:cytochrome c